LNAKEDAVEEGERRREEENSIASSVGILICGIGGGFVQ
jgi:hypothetical protein